MLCKAEFDCIFVGKRFGVTKDGEQYVSIDVLTKDNKKMSFISTNDNLIDYLEDTTITQFRLIRLVLGFSREFNPKTRFSNWTCTLEDVKLATD